MNASSSGAYRASVVPQENLMRDFSSSPSKKDGPEDVIMASQTSRAPVGGMVKDVKFLFKGQEEEVVLH